MVAAPDLGQLLFGFGQARAFNFGPLLTTEAFVEGNRAAVRTDSAFQRTLSPLSAGHFREASRYATERNPSPSTKFQCVARASSGSRPLAQGSPWANRRSIGAPCCDADARRRPDCCHSRHP